MARVKQRRRTGDLHEPHQSGNDDAGPNPNGKNKKMAPFARVFKPADDVHILGHLADYVEKHGKRPGPSELRIALMDFLEKAEYTAYTDTQIYEKVRRLKLWYLTKRAAGSVDASEATKYQLSTKIWGTEEAPEQAQPKLAVKGRAEGRSLEEMRRLFPNLSVIVDEIATQSISCTVGAVYKRAFELMDDEKAAQLEAKVEKQRIKECMMARDRELLSIQVLDMLIKS